MDSRLLWAATSLVLVGGTGRALAQSIGPARGQRPYSIVDEREGSGVFGPPGLPTPPNTLAPSYVIGSSSLTIGDGWPENFEWAEPSVAPTQPVPLIVVFHK